MVRASKYLEIYEEEKILDYVSNVAGPALLNGLHGLAAQFPGYIRNVRGKGLMCAFDVCCPECRDKLLSECMKNHMLILGCQGTTIRFRPALNVPVSDIEKGLDILSASAKKIFG